MIPAKRSIQALVIPFASLLLFVCGLFVCLYYGRSGFLPLDQSIVFDGGWRLLSGQVPFRDFTVPSALTPIVLQSLFFRFLGVNWFAYCLHAAVLNGFFCLLVFECLRMLRLPAPLAWGYGLCSSLIYYALIGTPYLEQHGFFFLLLALFCLLKLSHVRRRTHIIPLCFLLSLSLMLTYLSKQNVLLWGAFPVLALFIIAIPKQERAKIVLWGVLSLALWLFVICGFAAACGVNWGKVSVYFFQLPYIVGKERLTAVFMQFFPHIFLVLPQYLISPPLLLIAAVSALLSLLAAIFVKKQTLKPKQRRGLALVLLAGVLTFFSVAFALSTNHHKMNGYPYLFLSLGLLHCGLWHLFPVGLLKIFTGWLHLSILLFSGYEAYYLTTRFVTPRTILSGMKFQADEAATLQTPSLQFMEFFLNPRYYRFSAEDLDAVISFFAEQSGNFLLIGDTSILYGITGRPSPLPSLWLHQELTIPPPHLSDLWIQYQEELLDNIAHYNVKYIVLEGQGTMMGISVHSFPMLMQFLESQPVTMRAFGEFTILKLGN